MNSDRSKKSRFVLADVTNQHGKRTFSSILYSHKSKSGVQNPGKSHLPKQMPMGIENAVKETGNAKSQKVAHGIGSSPLGDENASLQPPYKTSSIQGGIGIDVQSSGCENKQGQHSASAIGGSLPADTGNASQTSVQEVSDTMKENFVSSPLMFESGKSCQRVHKEARSEPQGEIIHVCDDVQSDCTHEAVPSQVVCDDSNESATIPSAVKPTTQFLSLLPNMVEDSKSLELVRCSGLKGDGCSSSAPSVASLKDCTCSFCMKAAYMLSDLHYQDVKGRISALTKIKKETNSIVKMYCGENELGNRGQGNIKLPRLEVDLMSQWKSLFLHMEEIFVNESSQLENSFLALKDMRESCKMNLEMVHGSSSADAQQCSSDASNNQKF